MKEGVRYSLENPPLPEDLKPNESYLDEYNKWYAFKTLVEKLSVERYLEPIDFLTIEDLYQEAIGMLEQESDEEVGGGSVLA